MCLRGQGPALWEGGTSPQRAYLAEAALNHSCKLAAACGGAHQGAGHKVWQGCTACRTVVPQVLRLSQHRSVAHVCLVTPACARAGHGVLGWCTAILPICICVAALCRVMCAGLAQPGCVNVSHGDGTHLQATLIGCGHAWQCGCTWPANPGGMSVQET
jgi:hypothetical protein